MKLKDCHAKSKRNILKSMAMLEGFGWTCFRIADYRSDWDIVAIMPGHPLQLVQVRTNRKPVSVRIDEAAYDPRWYLSLHVWFDWKVEPSIYNARTMELLVQ